jgi:hypothetical protein
MALGAGLNCNDIANMACHTNYTNHHVQTEYIDARMSAGCIARQVNSITVGNICERTYGGQSMEPPTKPKAAPVLPLKRSFEEENIQQETPLIEMLQLKLDKMAAEKAAAELKAQKMEAEMQLKMYKTNVWNTHCTHPPNPMHPTGVGSWMQPHWYGGGAPPYASYPTQPWMYGAYPSMPPNGFGFPSGPHYPFKSL